MATRQKRRAPDKQTFKTGPFKGVRTTLDPLDDPPDLLYDATNVYIPDPEGSSGVYAIPGFLLLNGGAAISFSAHGQGIITHTDLANVTTNFSVMGGKLFRVDSTLSVFTDVTPVGVAIDGGATTRVYGTSFANQLSMTDGVNRPWLATNLTSTPITGTYIDYDSLGTAWTVFGPMRIYAGCVVAILNTVNSIGRRTDISWSLPGDASAGWQQTNYDFNWTLEQTGASPLYCLIAENTQLYYTREFSIGSVSGQPGPNFAGQSTHDAVSVNVGCIAPQSIVQFGTSFFFADALGRPYRYQQGAPEPDALWNQLRGIVDVSSIGYPAITKTVTVAAFEPTLNLYIVAPWSAFPSRQSAPTEGYAFDARTGTYFGRFVLGTGVQMEAMGTFTDANGRGVLMIAGSAVAPSATSTAPSGFLWAMNALVALGDFITTEVASPLTFITTEDGLTQITTEGTVANWLDNGLPKTISATTTLLGYDEEKVATVDRVIALVGNTSPCTVSLHTAAVAVTVEGTPTPSTVQDGISKLTVGVAGIQGRGVEATISPTTGTSQWSLQRITVEAIMNQAAPDDV